MSNARGCLEVIQRMTDEERRPVAGNQEETDMTTYLVNGFLRHTKQNVCMLVDHSYDLSDPLSSPHAIAERIAGSEYMFHACTNVNVAVPDEHKNVLLTSTELYARVPELDPTRRSQRQRRR